jgi:hypothetical protein
MCKTVTDCEKIIVYSRHKYGFDREKGLWQYSKLENEEIDRINEVVEKMLKTGMVTIEDEEDKLAAAVSAMKVSEEEESEEEIIEEADQYVDNPFKQWAFKPNRRRKASSNR